MPTTETSPAGSGRGPAGGGRGAAAPGRPAGGRRRRGGDAGRLGLAAGRRGARRDPPGRPQEACQAAHRRRRHAEEAMGMSSVRHVFLARSSSRRGHEARPDGSATVEAQHLLLAIAAAPERATAPGPGLGRARPGSDPRGAGPGVRAEPEPPRGCRRGRRSTSPRPAARRRHRRIGRLGQARAGARLGSVARKKDLQPAHLLLGILRAEVGTVPRALALAGVDRAELVAASAGDQQQLMDGGRT